MYHAPPRVKGLFRVYKSSGGRQRFAWCFTPTGPQLAAQKFSQVTTCGHCSELLFPECSSSQCQFQNWRLSCWGRGVLYTHAIHTYARFFHINQRHMLQVSRPIPTPLACSRSCSILCSPCRTRSCLFLGSQMCCNQLPCLHCMAFLFCVFNDLKLLSSQ